MPAPDANDHAFARIVADNDETTALVRKIVSQFNRGMLMERELLLALAEIDPSDLPDIAPHSP